MKRMFLALLAASVTTAGLAEDLFVSCDNGLRCVTAPCPSRDVVLLLSRKRYAGTEPRFEGLSEADRKRLAESPGLYEGTIVLGGAIDEGPPVDVVARRVVRPTTAGESRLCRR